MKLRVCKSYRNGKEEANVKEDYVLGICSGYTSVLGNQTFGYLHSFYTNILWLTERNDFISFLCSIFFCWSWVLLYGYKLIHLFVCMLFGWFTANHFLDLLKWSKIWQLNENNMCEMGRWAKRYDDHKNVF